MDGYLRGPRARSIQERGLIDLLDLARQRGCLPARRALVCIQPRRLEWGEALSLPVFQALPMAANRVVGLLERWRIA
jgi:hydrogenase maturation protease